MLNKELIKRLNRLQSRTYKLQLDICELVKELEQEGKDKVIRRC